MMMQRRRSVVLAGVGALTFMFVSGPGAAASGVSAGTPGDFTVLE